jgi:16S rRNA (adenine1518-N6/adenine1519-N6)-dimethyltransferase
LEAPVKPSRIVLTVQREVAERISAKPGKLSLLALSVQVYGQPRTVARIPAGAFYPPPKVDSAVVRVDLYAEPLIPTEQLKPSSDWRKQGSARSARCCATRW